jgi:hypothetical protein
VVKSNRVPLALRDKDARILPSSLFLAKMLPQISGATNPAIVRQQLHLPKLPSFLSTRDCRQPRWQSRAADHAF